MPKNYFPDIHIYFILVGCSIAQASLKTPVWGRFIFIGVHVCACHMLGEVHTGLRRRQQVPQKYSHRQLRVTLLGSEHGSWY